MSNAYIGDYDAGPALGNARVDWQGGQGNWGILSYSEEDKRAIVFFHKQAVWNEVKSIQAGRRIYDEQDFVSIQWPGEREQKIDRPVKLNEDPYRWPRQWEQYRNRQEQTVDGTPLDLLFVHHPGIADNLKSAGVSTVEQLANLSATGMQNIGMGAQDYVNYARAYLDHAKQGASFHEVQKELRDRDQKIKLQGQQIEALSAQIEKLTQHIGAMTHNFTAAMTAPQGQTAPKPEPFSLPPLNMKLPPVETPAHGVEPARGKD